MIGTKGHAIQPDISEALNEWAKEKKSCINYIRKSDNCLTEMYSIFEAEIPLDNDSSTQFNKDLMSKLKVADQLIICGQAMSHCVNFSTRDIVKHWNKEMKRVCLLSDGASSVPNCESDSEKFIKDMKHEGLSICRCSEVFKLFLEDS